MPAALKFETITDSLSCARCDRQMVITKDAVGRPRKRCPWCDGVAAVKAHPDEVLLPQGLVRVKFAALPPIEPGQLRCQICAHGVNPRMRFCDGCLRDRNKGSWRRSYRRRGELDVVGPAKARTYKPRACAFPNCGATFLPTGPRGSYCEAHR